MRRKLQFEMKITIDDTNYADSVWQSSLVETVMTAYPFASVEIKSIDCAQE